MNLIKKLFAKLVTFLTNGETTGIVTSLAVEALPFIVIAGQIVVGLTPTGIDDAVFAQIRLKFPRLFDGTIHTGDELKAYALAVAGELVKARFPETSTSSARAAVQLAYMDAASNPEKTRIQVTGPKGNVSVFSHG